MEGHFTARRHWLAAAAALASIVVVACHDVATAPGGSAPPKPQAGPLVNRVGESGDIEIYIPADPLRGENYVNFDASVNFRHTTYVRATVSGSVSQSSQYSMYFPPHTWTADQLSDGVSVSTSSYGPYPIPSAGVDIGFAPSLHTPNSASFGRLGHPVRTWDYYTPEGYPHVECGWTDQPPCVTYEGGFTVKLVPYKADLAIALDATSYLPGSQAAVHVWVPDSLQGSPDLHPMNWDQDSISWSSDVPGETSIDRNWSNCKLPNPCTHIVRGDADWTITGYVNGAYKSKTVHVKMATLKLKATPTSGPVNMPVNFTASWDDGHSLNPADVTSWAWLPDTAPGQTTKCNAHETGCQRNVKESGTMTVTVTRNGVVVTASAHVRVAKCTVPNDTLLNRPEMQDALRDVWIQSGAAADPTSADIANHKEIVWAVYIDSLTGDVSTYQVSASNNPCAASPVPIPPVIGSGKLAAMYHPHPFKWGQQYPSNCPPEMAGQIYGNPMKLLVGNGRASGYDWEASKFYQVPGYIIDYDGIYKYDGTSANLKNLRPVLDLTLAVDGPSHYRKWDRVDSSRGCQLP